MIQGILVVMYLTLSLCYLGLAITENSMCRKLYIACSVLWFLSALVNFI